MSSVFLPSRTFELFRQAIEQKKQIICQYRGYTRQVCPYVLGTNKSGKERVLAVLVGNNPSGPPICAGWECLELESVWNVKFKDDVWVAAPSGARPDCVEKVDLDVETVAA